MPATLPPLLALARGIRARPRKVKASEPRPRDRNAEARIQAAIVEWVRTVAPQVIVFHVPNGGLRTKAEAARMKWVGVLPGVFDLALIVPPLRFSECSSPRPAAIEVKTPEEIKKANRGLSAGQQQYELDLIRMDVPHCVACSIDDVRAFFRKIGVVTREVRTGPRALMSGEREAAR